MSTDNTDRTAPQAPVVPDDVATSSPTASTPTTRTPATDPRPEEATVNLADEALGSTSLASLADRIAQVSQAASPAPRATEAPDRAVAPTSAITGADEADTADDAAHDGADEEGTAAADDEVNTLNLREQASFTGATGSQAAETVKSAAGAVASATTNAAASVAGPDADTADDAAEDDSLPEEPTSSVHQEVHGAVPANHSAQAPLRPAASSPRPVVAQAAPTPSETSSRTDGAVTQPAVETAAATGMPPSIPPSSEPGKVEDEQAPVAAQATTTPDTPEVTGTSEVLAETVEDGSAQISAETTTPTAAEPVHPETLEDAETATAPAAAAAPAAATVLTGSTVSTGSAPEASSPAPAEDEDEVPAVSNEPTSQPTTAPTTTAAAGSQRREPVADTAEDRVEPEGLIEAEDFNDFDDFEDFEDFEGPAEAGDLDGQNVDDDRTPETPAIPTPEAGSPAVRAVPVSVTTGAARVPNGVTGATPQTATGATDAATGVDDTDDNDLDDIEDVEDVDDIDGELDEEAGDVDGVGEIGQVAGAGQEPEDDIEGAAQQAAVSASVFTAPAAQSWRPVPPADTTGVTDVEDVDDTDDGFVLTEPPIASAAFAAPSAARTSPTVPSADSPELTSSTRPGSEPEAPASAPSLASEAPVSTTADNRPSAPSWPATPAAQLARTGSAASASSARSTEPAPSAHSAFPADVSASTPSTEGMGGAPRTASSPYIGLSGLRPEAPADTPSPTPAQTAPQPERVPSTQSSPASTNARDYRPTPAASPSAPSPQQTPDWFAAAPTARGLSAGADAGESDDPEERGRSRARQAAMAMTGAGADDNSILLKGASVLMSTPGSRVETHWAGVLVAVVLFPLAWFLVHDGAATLTGGNPLAWPSAASPMGALEILGGTAAYAAALFMISRSSLGAFVVGAISTVIGLPFILMPGVTKSILGSTVERLQAHSDLGRALSTYVMDDGLSGRFILMGVLTIMVAVVAHLARQAGQHNRDDDHGPRD